MRSLVWLSLLVSPLSLVSSQGNVLAITGGLSCPLVTWKINSVEPIFSASRSLY